MCSVEYYFFDFDGTLVDSIPHWSGMYIDLLDKNGIDYPENIISIVTPMGHFETSEYLYNLGLGNSPEENHKNILKELTPVYHKKVPLKPFAKEKLEYLKSIGKHLNIITTSPHILVDECLKRNGIYDFFDNIWTCEDFSTPKSDPETYREALKRVNADANNAVFVDDNLEACTAAVKSGIFTVGIFDKNSKDKEEEIKKICNRYIENLSEL